MIDYFEGSIIDVPDADEARHLQAAAELSRSVFYWLQTEAPRADGGTGFPGLRLRGDVTGTDDGLAMAPYIRECRRIRAEYTVVEQDLSHRRARRPGRGAATATASASACTASTCTPRPAATTTSTCRPARSRSRSARCCRAA